VDEAVAHLKAALAFDPRYSAAWKLLGKALHDTGALTEALETYRQGIAHAEAKGDIQAAKEMTRIRQAHRQATGRRVTRSSPSATIHPIGFTESGARHGTNGALRETRPRGRRHGLSTAAR
jgi:predicted Zn-dependent protease